MSHKRNNVQGFFFAVAVAATFGLHSVTASASVHDQYRASGESRVAEASCRKHLRDGNFTAAIASASVALAQSNNSTDKLARFSTLLCRATANKELDNTLDAEYDYRESLRIAEKQFGPFEPELVSPLTELGRMRMQSLDEDEAELLFLRAKDITHRNAGIFNVEQDSVLRELTGVYMSQGRVMKAKHQQRLKLKAAEKTFGDSPELVNALHEYAKWAAKAGDFPQVRVALERAVSIQEDAFGPNHLGLVETLRLRAKLYEFHPVLSTPRTGERALGRVAEIYAAQDGVDQVDLINARTDLGDWYMRDKRRVKALQYYQAAVTKAHQEGIDERLINEFYGAPKLIRYDSGKTFFYGRNIDRSLRQGGHVVVEFHVSARGTTQNVRVIEDTVENPDVTAAVLFRINTSYFRPRFIDGEPVAASGVQYRFDIDQTGHGLAVGKVRGPRFVNRSELADF
ncbi:MAG: hypothetical protein AB8G18_05625 [Gammaproteobacteria bacterium]